MKVYLDALFFLNFGFDFLLLLSVSYLLRRNASIKRLVMGSLLGGSSIFFLFVPMDSFALFCFKFLISILMIYVTFGRKCFYQNMIYLYGVSITLGGVLYFLNSSFSYKQEGLIFYHNGFSINFILLFLIGPYFLWMYVKKLKLLKNQYSHYYEVDIWKKKKVYHHQAYLDTGNKLKEPYTGKPILLVFETHFIDESPKILVPYETIEGTSILPCIKCDKIVIKGVGERRDCYLGLLKKKPALEGISCILQEPILEGTYAH